MKYMKVWTNFLDLIRELEYDEVGRLFEMMLTYADSGKEPENFTGNERFLWPVAKQQLDFAAAKNEILRQNGQRGGRPKANETKQNQTEPEETSRKQTKAYKDKDKDKDKENNTGIGGFEQFWALYPKKVAKQDAMKAWAKVKGVELPTILDGLRRCRNSDQWTRDDGRYVPNPATWLNGRRWEDEVVKAHGRTIPATDFEQRDYSGVPEEQMAELARQMAEFRGA